MKRRDFITLVGGAAAVWPVAARAKQAERMRRIGVLMSVEENDPEGETELSQFTQGLAESGWNDGRNLRMEVRWGGGDVNRTRTFAKELVALQPDVILAQGTPGTTALQRETRTIPIVFVIVADPVGPGFVASLPRPGGNITGFINSESVIAAKMLELLTEIAPGLKRVAMIFNPDTAPGRGTYYFHDFETAARSSKLFPPGRLRLATRPIGTGSAPTLNRIGMVIVAALAARVGRRPAPMITAMRSWTSSAASAGSRSKRPCAQRYSILRFCLST